MTNGSAQAAHAECETLLRSRGFRGDVQKLFADIAQDEVLSKLSTSERNSAIFSALNAARDNPNGTKQLLILELSIDAIRGFAEKISSGAYQRPLNPERVSAMRARASEQPAAMNTGSSSPRNHQSHMPPGGAPEHWHRVNKALGWVGAGMMILGAVSSAQGIMTTDEAGGKKINASPLLWTLLQGTMAAGLLYLVHHQPSLTNMAVR